MFAGFGGFGFSIQLKKFRHKLLFAYGLARGDKVWGMYRNTFYQFRSVSYVFSRHEASVAFEASAGCNVSFLV